MDPSQPLLNSNPYWIYPLHIIQLKNTTTMCGNLTLNTSFLCTSISLISPFFGNYQFGLIWRKDKLPWRNISFIFANSNRPRNQSYNVCISQILPIIYSASCPKMAFFDTLKLVSLFEKNGFKPNQLYHIILKFLNTSFFLGLRFDIQLLVSLFGGQ